MHCVEIYLKDSVKHDGISGELIEMFMKRLSRIISFHTDLSYYAPRVVKFVISIPLTKFDKTDDKLLEDFVKERVTYAKDKIESTRLFSDDIARLTRELYHAGIDPAKSFGIRFVDPTVMWSFDGPLNLQLPVALEADIERYEFSDKSAITYIFDPYVSDYCEMTNLSIPFAEMGFGHNYLHYYEHMMTVYWSELAHIPPTYYNAFTTRTGICIEYSGHKDIGNMKKYASANVTRHLKARSMKYWDSVKSELDTERRRTISECMDITSLSFTARSSREAYYDGYDVNVLHYWANRPFEMLIIGKSPIKDMKLNHDSVEAAIKKNPIQSVNKPQTVSYGFYPLEVAYIRNSIKQYTSRVSSKSIKDYCLGKFKNNMLQHGELGVDVCMTTRRVNKTMLIYPLLVVNHLFTVDELKQILRSITNTPFTGLDYLETPLSVFQ